MQSYILNKLNKQILCILILFIMLYILVSFLPITEYNSNATTYTYSKDSNDLPSNFNTTYPGYQSLLQTLAKAHPNWTFKLYETGLDWETVINSEYQAHEPRGRKNLVPSSSTSEWICSICGKEKDSGNWYCASRGAIEYIMDPRNSLNDANIFQYLLLSNDANVTKSQVNTMASKISYLDNDEIVSAIYDAAKELNINPFYIIGKILQEQGSNGSVMCAGNGYKGEYVGYYNLFNVKASGETEEEVIRNGLKYAKSQGWNSAKKSIIGGIGTIKSYINRGQDTLYYQKFNVVCESYYQNQYAQNLLDAQSIGQTLKGYYKDSGLLESSFTFEIPLYKNMPSSAVKSPSTSSVSGELAYINANGGLALRSSPAGTTIAYVNEGEQVVITKRATAKSSDGYYWDQVYTPNGTGYMAREAKDGSKTYLVVIGENSSLTTGDCNGDGKVDSMDMYKIIQHILKEITLKDKYFEAADTNGDSKIDSMDMYNVIQIILKK